MGFLFSIVGVFFSFLSFLSFCSSIIHFHRTTSPPQQKSKPLTTTTTYNSQFLFFSFFVGYKRVADRLGRGWVQGEEEKEEGDGEKD